MKPLRPYIYYAYYSWICDNNSTPYLLVNCNYPDVDVPIEFIRDGKIILNTHNLSLIRKLFFFLNEIKCFLQFFQ